MSLKAYVKLTRLDHGVLSVIGVLAGLLTNCSSNVSVLKITIAVVVPLFIEMGLFALNDYFNIEEDKINAPDRPLVRGDISPKAALTLGIAALLIGYTAALLAILEGRMLSIVLITLIIIIGVLYDARIKTLGLIGNLIVSFSTASTFIYGALLAKSIVDINMATWIIFITAFLSCLGREILKGVRDYLGDKKAGVLTLAVKYGTQRAVAISSILIVSAIVAALSNIIYVKKPAVYTVLLIPAVMLFAVAIAISFKNPDDVKLAEKARKYTLYAMGLGLIAFLAGMI
ncbi:MAG: hypothetical protein DRN04_01485 [Thermoprotei archaeon]|nr:MAG: hypothetical protein DRN04_01485 [Thermoprotei archaeon]